ncbi:MAG: hypothetical protein ABIK44_06160 [candidate division WOR-3 bacterium]
MAFAKLIGQPRIARMLNSLVNSGSYPSLLFTGQSGVGKRTAALYLAQAANCEQTTRPPCGLCRSCRTIALLQHPDIKLLIPLRPPHSETEPAETVRNLYELLPEYSLAKAQPQLDPKHTIGIGLVRWLRSEIARPPTLARQRFFIILHAHQMTREAINALLKMLEEPHPKTCFLLTTDRPGELLPTVRSRCQTLRFANIPEAEIREWLSQNTTADSATTALAAAVASGSLGRALQFIKAPEELFNSRAARYFTTAELDMRVVLKTMSELVGNKSGLAAVTQTFFLLYNMALREKLDLSLPENPYRAAAKIKSRAISLRQLHRIVDYLRLRLDDSQHPIYSSLAMYTLLSALLPDSPVTNP